jgi:Uma2 family endonuclease
MRGVMEARRGRTPPSFPRRRLFSVGEFHALGRAGILRETDRVELIRGEILRMSPIGSRHAACVDRLNRRLVAQVGARAIVRIQNPLRLGSRSEVQPDIALVRPVPDFYAKAHPGPRDVLLVVEVAEHAEIERRVKIPLYADHRLREVWLVDLGRGLVEAYSRPAEGRYRDIRREGPEGVLKPRALWRISVAVKDLLG